MLWKAISSEHAPKLAAVAALLILLGVVLLLA